MSEKYYSHSSIFVLISTVFIILFLIFCRYYEIGFITLEEYSLVLCGELYSARREFV